MLRSAQNDQHSSMLMVTLISTGGALIVCLFLCAYQCWSRDNGLDAINVDAPDSRGPLLGGKHESDQELDTVIDTSVGLAAQGALVREKAGDELVGSKRLVAIPEVPSAEEHESSQFLLPEMEQEGAAVSIGVFDNPTAPVPIPQAKRAGKTGRGVGGVSTSFKPGRPPGS